MKLLIAGDLVPYGNSTSSFEKGNREDIIGQELSLIWDDYDYRFVNLEAPITETQYSISKLGPNLKTSFKCLPGIKNLNIDCFNLANNHIMDFGEKGLTDTLEIIKDFGAEYVGVGENLEKLKKIVYFEKNGEKIGVLSCAENEFSIATENKPGANPLDFINIFDDISNAAASCDYLIVLFHGGVEQYRYPTPNHQKVLRKMIDKGADLVITQHSHCLGSMEKYENGIIIYGQGNFIFNKWSNEFWNTRALVEVNTIDNTINFIPIIPTESGVRIASEMERKQIMDDFFERSSKIIDPEYVERKFNNLVVEKQYIYFRSLMNCGKWFRRVDKFIFRGKLINLLLKQTYFLKLKNYYECESHQEIIRRAINMKLEK